MIISDKLLFVHMPKTGGAFMRKYLQGELAGAKLLEGSHWHDPISDINIEKMSDKTIIGIIRNPLSWYVSFFYDNIKMTPITLDALKKANKEPVSTKLMQYFDPENSRKFDVFMNNLFDEIDNGNIRSKFSYNTITLDFELMRQYDIGLITMIYLYMYFPKYKKIKQENINIFKRHDELLGLDYICNQDSLNHDLMAILTELHPEIDEFKISNKYANVNVTKREHWSNYYSDDLIERVLYKDRLIFENFQFNDQ